MTSTKTSFPAALLTSIRGLVSGSTSNIILLSTASCLLAPIIYYLYRYRVNIKQKVKEIEKNVGRIRVIRNTTCKNNRVICMELDPNFVKSYPDWSMMSLGEYLSQLEPADKENTVILLQHDQVKNIWPLLTMTAEEKVNAVTRLIILLSIVGYLLTLSTKIFLIAFYAIVTIAMHRRMRLQGWAARCALVVRASFRNDKAEARDANN